MSHRIRVHGLRVNLGSGDSLAMLRRMRRTAALFTALGIVAALAVVPAAQGSPSRPKAAHPMLWRVASPKGTLHLFGSVHVGSPDVYPLAPPIREAFRAAQTLVLEIPLDAETQARATQLLLEAAKYEPPDSLSRHLDADTRAKLREALRGIGLPSRGLEPLRPWFAALTLGLTHAQRLGYHPELGLDQHFQRLLGDKKAAALETAEDQVAVFRDLPDALQVQMLRQTLDELDELQGMLADTFAAWQRGDATALDALLLAPLRQESPALYARLFTDRNRRMTERLTAMLARGGSYFVVVGAGHLVGPDSLVEMLRKRGLDVTRI